MAHCPNCGKEIVSGSKYCTDCGIVIDGSAQTSSHNQAPNRTVAVSVKNPGVAAVLSFFLCGLGQIYDGKIWRGLLFIVIEIVLVALWDILVSLVVLIVFWVWNIFDAHKIANVYDDLVETTGNRPW